MNEEQRERVRARFEDAEGSLPPLRPDRGATLRRGHRLLYLRMLATLGIGAVIFLVLSGGGNATREVISTGKTDGPLPAGESQMDQPDLVLTLDSAPGGGTLQVENRGRADQGPFVVTVTEDGVLRQVGFEGLAAGESSDAHPVQCAVTVEVRIEDPEQRVGPIECAAPEDPGVTESSEPAEPVEAPGE